MKKFVTLSIVSVFGFFSTKHLRELVTKCDQAKPLFLVPMLPIRDIGPFSYTTSSDPFELVPCTVVEGRYKLSENYKIQVEATVPGYGKEAFYVLDFVQMVRSGHIQVIDQTAPEIMEPTGLTGFLLRLKERVAAQAQSFSETVKHVTNREHAARTFARLFGRSGHGMH